MNWGYTVVSEPQDDVPMEQRFTRIAQAAMKAAQVAMPTNTYDTGDTRRWKCEVQARIACALIEGEMHRV